MSRQFPFVLRGLLVLLLAVACFFGGIQFEGERHNRADEADRLAAAEWAARRVEREVFLQQQKPDEILVRFNVLMAEGPGAFPDTRCVNLPDSDTWARLTRRQSAKRVNARPSEELEGLGEKLEGGR